MEQFQIFKQMAQFNKTAFDNSYNTMTMFREQNEKMANSLLDQATWMPEEGKKVINEWMKALQEWKIFLAHSIRGQKLKNKERR